MSSRRFFIHQGHTAEKPLHMPGHVAQPTADQLQPLLDYIDAECDRLGIEKHQKEVQFHTGQPQQPWWRWVPFVWSLPDPDIRLSITELQAHGDYPYVDAEGEVKPVPKVLSPETKAYITKELVSRHTITLENQGASVGIIAAGLGTGVVLQRVIAPEGAGVLRQMAGGIALVLGSVAGMLLAVRHSITQTNRDIIHEVPDKTLLAQGMVERSQQVMAGRSAEPGVWERVTQGVAPAEEMRLAFFQKEAGEQGKQSYEQRFSQTREFSAEHDRLRQSLREVQELCAKEQVTLALDKASVQQWLEKPSDAGKVSPVLQQKLGEYLTQLTTYEETRAAMLQQREV